ncbi:MAG: pseudaminic acid cytidylyltransferase [Bdellovibrionota bacterium]|jgi:pseudaminic acid cytidylyltransferase
MKSIAIIPARGGSKRIPRKNIKPFLGRPIIAFSIEAALESKVFDEVMVSTDDAEIAEIAKQYGADVPFFRSAETASDLAMTVPVLLECLEKYKALGQSFDYLSCVYPCAPFIKAARLRDAMQLLITENVDSVVPVVKFSYPPARALVIRGQELKMLYPENYNVRSQDLEAQYHDAGQFYCLRAPALERDKRLFCENSRAIVLSDSEVQDIDTLEDWETAEVKFKILMERAR